MPHLSKPQTKALAAFSVGIAEEEGCGLSAAAKKLPFAENPATVERRIQRFIANDRIDHAESRRAMAKWVIGSLPEDKPVVLVVDETGLNDRLKAMVEAVAFEGRSIPVAWRRCPQVADGAGGADNQDSRMGSGRYGQPGRRQESDSDGGQGNRQLAELSDAPGMSWRRRARAFRKSGMESGAREPAVAGGGAVVCVDGELVSRGVQLEQGGERGFGRRVAGGALRAVQSGPLTCSTSALSGGAAASVRRCSQPV